MFQGINTTVTGFSHIEKGIVCQDSSGVFDGDDFAIAVVADGHGSRRHFRSDAGSRIAVKITAGLISKYMARPDFRKQFLRHPEFILIQMEKQILMKWREAVEEFHRENPLTDEEKEILKEEKKPGSVPVIYGSTVLAAVMGEEFSFGMVLGDGGLVVLDDKNRLFIPVEDPNAHANYTSSLCNTNALHFFEHWYTKEEIRGMFVSTDGLFKSFASEEDFLKYHGLILKLLDDPDQAKKSLERNFAKRTKDGSGDDISIAMIYRT
ncbi:MAG: protein phosphatase 2C domain-containing protein [Eubacterium sp.]|nr:protein phosphatase 2C domain-containing protein [Eubacterium sp.]